MLAGMNAKSDEAPSELTSVQAAWDTARRAAPEMNAMSLVFPGSRFGTPVHYLIWTKGGSPLTARLFTPVLVDARSGDLAALVKMPWYLRALELSRPLHFGDYGGSAAEDPVGTARSGGDFRPRQRSLSLGFAAAKFDGTASRRIAGGECGRMSVWRWPLLLAGLTILGLLSALLGQHGVWFWLSWLTLSVPLAVIVGAVLQAR